MAIGSFFIERIKKTNEEKQKKQRQKHHEEKKESEYRENEIGCRVSILFLGRTQTLLRDYLCAMNENMNETSGAEGLAFYTKDHATMMQMVENKKKLERSFLAQSQGLPEFFKEEEKQEKETNYFFDISLAGKQSRCVEFSFFCITEEELVQGKRTLPSEVDAVWLLGEVPFLEEGRKIGAENVWAKEQKIPVYFLLSQFEYLERFRVYNKEITLREETYEKLIKWGKNALPESSDLLQSWQMLPIQMYGSIQFTDWDEEGNPIYKIDENGFYQRYVPVGCQMPLFYTLEQYIKAQKTNFFTEYDGNKLWNAILQCFLPYCGNRVLTAKKFTKEEKKTSEKAEI